MPVKGLDFIKRAVNINQDAEGCGIGKKWRQLIFDVGISGKKGGNGDMELEGEELRQAVIKAQADEETGVVLYSYLAKGRRDENNRKIFEAKWQDEQKHAGVWEIGDKGGG